MAVARAYAVGLVGMEGHVVEVEADLAVGLPGLPDAALAEARDRVRAAVVNSGQAWPQRRITLGLSPAWLRKRSTGFDLAIQRWRQTYSQHLRRLPYGPTGPWCMATSAHGRPAPERHAQVRRAGRGVALG